MPDIEVYPKLGETYPDAAGVPITSVGAIVSESKYIEDALRDGFLLTWDPLNIYNPDDRRSTGGIAPATAPYITLGADATLTAERVLTAGPGITLTDGGPNGAVTISASGGGGAVSSVFGRVGAVIAVAGDYTSSLVTNVSAVAGATVTAALNAINSALGALVQGPASADDNAVARFDGTSGKLVQSSGVTISDTDLVTAAGFLSTGNAQVNGNIIVSGTVDGTDVSALAAVPFVTTAATGAIANERVLTGTAGQVTVTDGGAGAAVTISTPTAVQGPASVGTDSRLAIFSGTTGKLVKESAITASGANDIGNIGTLTAGSISVSTNITVGGTVDGVDVSVLGADVAALKVPSYLTLATTGTLTNERVLTQGTGITITDGGAGGNVTISASGASVTYYESYGSDPSIVAPELQIGVGLKLVDLATNNPEVSLNLVAGDGIVLTEEPGEDGFTGVVVVSLDPSGDHTSSLASSIATSSSAMSDVGLSAALVAGVNYKFKFSGGYQAAALTTGIAFTLSGPATSTLIYKTVISTSMAGAHSTQFHDAYGSFQFTTGTDSGGTTYYFEVEGNICPSASGTLSLRFASEVAGSAVTVLRGASCQVWKTS